MSTYIKSKDITFIHIPKTGGTSVSRWLGTFANGERVGSKHLTIDQWTELFHKPKHYFTVVRNPYARLLSYYFYSGERAKQRINSPKYLTKYKQIIKAYEGGFSKSFEYDRYYSEMFLQNQTDYFNNEVSYILKTETLDNDFKQIQRWLDIYEPLPFIKKSKSVDYKDFYTTKEKKFVEKYFEKDLDLLKYTF